MNLLQGLRAAQLTGSFRICLRQYHTRKPKKPTTGFQGPKGHGEKLWIFSDSRTGQVVYSFRPALDGHHALKQIPFNGKKKKPAKIRKDYWGHMAVVDFGEGNGHIGRSVFQKLRELKHIHEVAWPDELRYKHPDEYNEKDHKRIKEEEEEKGRVHRPVRSKYERGRALNAQKPNSVADLATVLAGAGGGNRMLIKSKEDTEGMEPALLNVTVRWTNEWDKNYAESWSGNVTHGIVGPEEARKAQELEVEEEPESTDTAPEAAAGPTETTSEAAAEPEAEKKAERAPERKAEASNNA